MTKVDQHVRDCLEYERIKGLAAIKEDIVGWERRRNEARQRCAVSFGKLTGGEMARARRLYMEAVECQRTA